MSKNMGRFLTENKSITSVASDPALTQIISKL